MKDIKEIIELLKNAPHTREIGDVELLYIDAKQAAEAVALLEEYEKLGPIIVEWAEASKGLQFQVEQLKDRIAGIKGLVCDDV